jgi:hypothetical protein
MVHIVERLHAGPNNIQRPQRHSAVDSFVPDETAFCRTTRLVGTRLMKIHAITRWETLPVIRQLLRTLLGYGAEAARVIPARNVPVVSSFVRNASAFAGSFAIVWGGVPGATWMIANRVL